MKKTVTIFIIAAIMATLLSVCTCAAGDNLVFDEADLLTEAEEKELGEKLQAVSEKFNYKAAVYTTEAMEDGYTSYKFTEHVYDELIFDENAAGGAVIMVAMETRDVYVFYDQILNDSIAESIRESATPYLSDGDYFDAFDSFVWDVEYYLDGEINGYPIPWFTTVVVSIVVGLVVALIVTGVMKSQLKSVAFNRAAENYVARDSFSLTESRDSYLYCTVSRVAKPKNNSSSSGSSSSGRGGSGGKF